MCNLKLHRIASYDLCFANDCWHLMSLSDDVTEAMTKFESAVLSLEMKVGVYVYVYLCLVMLCCVSDERY